MITKVCEDIDECNNDIYPCGIEDYSTCLNIEGAFICACRDGFKNENGRESICMDTNECDEFDCGFNNTCTNTIGSYQCECGDGYYNDDEWEPCQDIDECSTETLSYEKYFCQDGICSNYIGGYNCTCPTNDFLSYDNGPNKVPFCGNFLFKKS